MSIPNLITLMRVILVPVVFWLLVTQQLKAAFLVFVLAGISDGIDGFLAKRFHWETELGAYLDPIADKLLLVSVFIMLAILGAIPDWLVVLIVSRDVLIVGAVVLSDVLEKPVTVRPLMVSKATTFVQIVLAIAVLGGLAGFDWLAGHAFWLVPAAAVLTGASAAAYLVTWLRHMAGGENA